MITCPRPVKVLGLFSTRGICSLNAMSALLITSAKAMRTKEKVASHEQIPPVENKPA